MATALFPAGADDVLYVVDLSGYVFRAYHAVAPLTSPSGEPTHAVFGTVNMLERLVRQRRPAMFAVAMDSRTRTFRKELYPAYKANRPPPPEDLKVQMARCREIVDAFGVPVFQEDGLEADDLIAAAVKQARERGLRVVIVSADKDLMQLVGPDVQLWDTMRNRVFGPAEVTERFGVRIDQLRDWLALTGDSSDNVPGVPSVGPKTATELLSAFDTLDGVYEHLGEIKRKALRAKLEDNHDQAKLSQRLVTLKEDATVDFEPSALAWGGRDVAALRRIYAELGFQRQLDALDGAEGPAQATEPRGEAQRSETVGEPAEVICALVTTEDALATLLRAIRKSGRLALLAHGSSDEPMRADLIGLSLCPGGDEAFYLPLAHRYVGVPGQLGLAAVLDALGSTLTDAKVALLGHDVKYTEVLLARHGLPLGQVTFDSMLAAYLLDASSRHDLETLAEGVNLGLAALESITKKKRGQQLGFDEISVEEARDFAAPRAAAVTRLSKSLPNGLREAGLTRLFQEMELPLSRQLAAIEQTGVLVDVDVLAKLGKSVDTDLSRLEEKAREIAGKEFNVHSPRQLETLLFDELGLKPIKRTKTARSTDAATLEALADEHELPAVILEIRQLAKLKGTYIDALPSLVHPQTGRIHTRWGQAVAATGRLSSHDPNLQNIPIRSELGRAIRAAFVAPKGHVLLSADYSQIELRVLAHLSEDAVLVDAFRSGQDVHTRTAMEIFELDRDELTPEHRRRAKAVNFGIVYGQGDSGLAKSLGIPRAEAASFIAKYFRRYEGVRRFMDETLERARAGDSVQTLFGRRRIIPDIKSSNRARRLAAERIAMNTPIQGTAADLLKLAMLALREAPTPGARMILTVHDELVFEVPVVEAERAGEVIRGAMEHVHELRVPLVVDVGAGKNWSEAH